MPTKVCNLKACIKTAKKEGLRLYFYPNGMIHDSITYKQGNKSGTCYEWHENGYPRDSSTWNNDGSGVEISWFDNGMPSSAGRYSAGYKMNGKWQFFYKEGKQSEPETYSNDTLINKQYFDESGNIRADTASKDQTATFPGGMKAGQKYISKCLFP